MDSKMSTSAKIDELLLSAKPLAGTPKTGKASAPPASTSKPPVIHISVDDAHYAGVGQAKVWLEPSDPTAGPRVDLSNNVHKVELVLEVGLPARAILHTYNVEVDARAELALVRDKLLPPKKPGEEIVFTVYEPVRRWWGKKQSRYTIEKHTPLPGYGCSVLEISSGWTSLVGPYEFRKPV